MHISRSGSEPSTKGPADYFTGTVRVDPLFEADAPARVAGASVTFEPGARTAWHTRLLGQTLIVTAGLGRVQTWGGPVAEIRPGDVIWFPPGESRGPGHVVIVFGSTGTAGRAVVHACLADASVSQVRALTRRPLGLSHAKLLEVACTDFANLDSIAPQFEGVDCCPFCLGTSVRNVEHEDQ